MSSETPFNASSLRKKSEPVYTDMLLKEVVQILAKKTKHDYNNLVTASNGLIDLELSSEGLNSSSESAMRSVKGNVKETHKLFQRLLELGIGSRSVEEYFYLEEILYEEKENVKALLPQSMDLDYALEEEKALLYLPKNKFKEALWKVVFFLSDKIVPVGSFEIGTEGDEDGNVHLMLKFSPNDYLKKSALDSFKVITALYEEFDNSIEMSENKQGINIDIELSIAE